MKIIIMRGVSGSGKSTVAKAVADLTGGKVISADEYFHLPARGGKDRDVGLPQPEQYDFNPSELGFAHAYCMRNFLEELEWGGALIVDNTNTSAIEVAPYLLAAQAARAEIYIVHVHCDVEAAVRRNIHGVPKHAVEAMAERLLEPLPAYWPKEIHVWGDMPMDVFHSLADVPAGGGMSILESREHLRGSVTSLVYDPAPYAGYEDEEGNWVYTRQALCIG